MTTPGPDQAGDGPEERDSGLARERTSLSWTRTAIAFAALGGTVLKVNLATGLIILVIAPLIWQLGRVARGAIPEAAGQSPAMAEVSATRLFLITVSIVGVALLCLIVAILGRSAPGALRLPAAGHSCTMDQRPRPRTAELLDLRPHPEGGWFRETWRAAPESVPDGYPGPRAAATGIYFLLVPGEESAWHRVRSDEVWLWHCGGPLALLDGGDRDTPSDSPAIAALGSDLASGQLPQHVIPAGHWQSARPASASEVLVSCVVAPGFDFADFTLFPG